VYVYIGTGDHRGTFAVGFYLTKWKHDGKPYNEWQEESVHNTKKDAACRVNYLNGGTGEPMVDHRNTDWRNPYKNKSWYPYSETG